MRRYQLLAALGIMVTACATGSFFVVPPGTEYVVLGATVLLLASLVTVFRRRW